MIYSLLRLLARAAVTVFHRRVVVENVERVPPEGAVVFAANHPNMMLDVLLLGAMQPRKLHFLAKSTLFHNPLLRFLLESAGTLPVYRRSENDPGELGKNRGTFEACHRILAQGGAIAIFPEGVTHAESRVLPLKTGVARIVLEAEAAHAFGLGSRVMPVGLTFSHRELFRADAHVVFGEPLDPSAFFSVQRDGGGSEPTRVRELTDEVERRLAKLTEHMPSEEDGAVVAVLRGFFAMGGDGESFSARLEIDRQLLDAITDFRERRPLDYARLRRRLLAYGKVLALSGLETGDLGRGYPLGPVLRYLAPRTALALVGLLPFVAGFVTSYLPYKIPGLLADRPRRHPVERATLKLVYGLVIFPLAYVLEAFVIARYFFSGSAGATLACLLALPTLGLFALVYAEVLADFLREVRVFFQRGRRARLERWRDELARELELRRAEYEAAEKARAAGS